MKSTKLNNEIKRIIKTQYLISVVYKIERLGSKNEN
jgi:hypothetical protein